MRTGLLGAAAAAACASGLDPERTVIAVGIAGCQLPMSLPPAGGCRGQCPEHLLRPRCVARTDGRTGSSGRYHRAARCRRDARWPTAGRRSPCRTARFEILSGYGEYAAVRHVHYAARCALELRGDVPLPRTSRRSRCVDLPEAHDVLRNPRSGTPLQSPVLAVLRLPRCCAGAGWTRRSTAVRRSTTRCCVPGTRRRPHDEPGWAGRRAARLPGRQRRPGHRDLHLGSARRRIDAVVRRDTDRQVPDVLHGHPGPPRATALAEHLLRAPLSDNVFPPG